MRHLLIDRRDHARRARLRRGPSIDLDEAARMHDRAAVVQAAASQLTRRAARFLTQARREPASVANLAVDDCRTTVAVPEPSSGLPRQLGKLDDETQWEI
jgi:hypothetical protein